MPDTRLTLGFSPDGPHVGFRAGCNWMNGKGALKGGKLQLSEVMSTAMYCQGLMDQESWYAEFMGGSPTVTTPAPLADAVTLTLVSGSTTIVYLDKEVATPDKALTAGTWEVWQLCDAIVCHRGAEEVGTVRFEPNGTASLFDFCRNGTATYAVTGNHLVVSQLTYEDKACTVPGSGYDQDGWNAVVQKGEVLTFEIDASTLTLERGGFEIRFNLVA